jgi:hypothetical protein
VTSNKGRKTSTDMSFVDVNETWDETLTDDDLFESFYRASLLVDLIKSRDLDEPTNIVREQIMIDNPFRELVPLIHRSTINTDTPFAVLRVWV